MKVSSVVSKPIDDGMVRPKFKIGRKDLANGDYLIGGGIVYDTVQEAENYLIESIKSEIKRYEQERDMADEMAKMLSLKLKSLENA